MNNQQKAKRKAKRKAAIQKVLPLVKTLAPEIIKFWIGGKKHAMVKEEADKFIEEFIKGKEEKECGQQ